MTSANTAAPQMRAQETETFDIEQASKACGLSAGVLRMWELRYGWPRPGRHANGYRYFTRYQVEDLKRMAALVKSGMLIGKLIHEGMPRWPSDGTTKPKQGICLLEATNALPAPHGHVAIGVRDRLITALKTQNHGRTWEMLLRCTWEVHPSEQVLAGWLPCLVALEEYRLAGKPMPKQEQLEKYVQDHIRGFLGRFPPDVRPLWVVPTSERESCVAYVASLLLSQKGRIARPWQWEKMPASAKFVTVGSKPLEAGKFPADQHEGHLVLIDRPDAPGLTALARENASHPVLKHA